MSALQTTGDIDTSATTTPENAITFPDEVPKKIPKGRLMLFSLF